MEEKVKCDLHICRLWQHKMNYVLCRRGKMMFKKTWVGERQMAIKKQYCCACPQTYTLLAYIVLVTFWDLPICFSKQK